jgi:hypothetical protein
LEQVATNLNHFSDTPTLFILFILSHGDADGKIMTDTKTPGKENYESFTTEAVVRALKSNKLLENTLKLVFFGVSFLASCVVRFNACTI